MTDNVFSLSPTAPAPARTKPIARGKLVWFKHGVGAARPHTPDCTGMDGETICAACNGPGHWIWTPDVDEPVPGLERAMDDHNRELKGGAPFEETHQSLAEVVEVAMLREIGLTHKELGKSQLRASLATTIAKGMLAKTWTKAHR